MANYTVVVSGVDGARTSDDIELMQAATLTPVIFDFIQADMTPYIFEVGDAITGTFVDNETLEEFSISGTITPTTGANTASWARSSADAGTPAEYRLYMKVARASAFDYTEPSPLTILEVPGVGIVPPSPLVGVSIAEAAWLAGAFIAVPDPNDLLTVAFIDDKADKITPAVVGDFAALDATGNLTDSGSAAGDFDTVGSAAAVQSNLTTHEADLSNPHAVTKAQTGLGNADNTSDVNKPISTATQTALDLKTDETDFAAHTGDLTNPHAVTAVQAGADTLGSAAAVAGGLTTHEGLTGTAVHGLGTASTSAIGDFDPTGSAATVQGNLTTHEADLANPHAVSLAQVGGTTDHTVLSNIGTNTHPQIDTHIGSVANPHGVTYTQAGADVAGAAAVVAGNLTSHEGLTGTTVHGLGTASTSAVGDFAPALGADDNYVTDAEKVVIADTSGTNTGDSASDPAGSAAAVAGNLVTHAGLIGASAHGLGTASTSASTDFAPALGIDDNYVTDAEKVVIGNTSGANTGDSASDPVGSASTAQAFAIQRANHTGTQTLSTISDAGTAAASASSDFAPALGIDDNYVTDAEKVVIGNTSGTNTGDSASDPVGSAAAAQAFAIQRTNHTGTQLAATVSDFGTQVAATALLKASNLSDVASTATSRSNLGLGTMAVETATDYYPKSDFSSSPTTAEPLKADGTGGLDLGGGLTVTPPSPVSIPILSTNGTTSSATGLSLASELNGASSQFGTLYQTTHTPTAGISSSYGLSNIAIIGTSAFNVTSMRGYFVDLRSTVGFTGSVTNARALEIGASSFIGNSPATLCGIYIENQTAGTSSNYAIYTKAGDVRLMATASDKLGFHGSTPVAQQTITGSTAGNAALQDLLTKLAATGILVDSTT